MDLLARDEDHRTSMLLRICGIGLRSGDAGLSELLGKWADEVESLEQQLWGAVEERDELRRLLELVRDRPDWASVQSVRDTVRAELDRSGGQ
jgi:hypothetical protein